MNKSMKKTQKELERIAEKATALSEWLGDKSFSAASHMPLPTEVVTVTAIVVATGSIVMMDGSMVPDSTCWYGCSVPN